MKLSWVKVALADAFCPPAGVRLGPRVLINGRTNPRCKGRAFQERKGGGGRKVHALDTPTPAPFSGHPGPRARIGLVTPKENFLPHHRGWPTASATRSTVGARLTNQPHAPQPTSDDVLTPRLPGKAARSMAIDKPLI